MINRIIEYFLKNRLVTVILVITFVVWGIVSAPFNWNTGFLPRDPVPVDAIPDIGDNQQKLQYHVLLLFLSFHFAFELQSHF